VYGVALDSVGQTEKAIQVLAAAHTAHSGNREILEALASYSAKAGSREAAIGWARKLVELDPLDPAAQTLLGQLSAAR
jgi:Flp pilus assembly protein TadD